jgi:DNA-binding FrmR family transcriptional regulator
MAAHESLAAGLIGLWAAIFAGWLAYSGIQMQIEEDRQKVALSQIAAKQAAVTAITHAIHATAMTLYAVTQAQKAQDPQQITHWT